MAHSTDTKAEFIRLRARGLSYDKIAKRLGLSKATLITWSKDLRSEIANLRNMEIEALQERYSNTLETRLKLFGQLLTEVRKELNKRDLSEVATKDLFDLVFRLSSALKKEQTETSFQEKMRVNDLLKNLDETVNIWPAP